MSTTVVSQLTSSYKYMLGPLSKLSGVQSYSDSPKKSSSFLLIDLFTWASARARVVWNDAVALTRMAPPRWDDLRVRFCEKLLTAIVGKNEPDVCQRSLQFCTCNLEVLEVGYYLCNLGQIGSRFRSAC